MNIEEIKLTVLNESGLHTRAAALIVDTANKYKSEITIEKDGSTADARSIMGILILAAQQNSEILVKASGVDAKEAVAAIKDLLCTRFGEIDKDE